MRRLLLSASIFMFFAVSPAAHAETYTLDKDHTTVGFKVRHLLSWVNGSFKNFDGTFEYDSAKPETWKVNATIEAASIDTAVTPRDKHLRSKDFFDVEQFPAITFKSTGVREFTGNTVKLDGNLTIHGVTKPVTLDVEILGEVTDPWGNELSAFSATTKINRTDFGLTWNKAVETGQLLVGEEVVISLEVSGMKKKPEAPAASV